jgi:hypothetical protein
MLKIMEKNTINKIDTSIIKLNDEVRLLNLNLNSLNKKCNILIYGNLITIIFVLIIIIIFVLIINKICIELDNIY